MPSFGLPSARAEASRRNGAKSCGPKTPEGKLRSSQNALKHGLRAQKCVVLPGESAAEFAALEAALLEELAPEGALQSVLAQRVVAATSRLARADRLEADVFEVEGVPGRSLGLALIRDCNGRQGRVGERGPQPLSGPGAAASTRCCATAAARWPSRGAPCARSRRSRPSRRRVPSLPPHPASPSHTKRRLNPRAAETLAIQAERTSPNPIRLQPPPARRTGHWPRPANRHRAFSRSNPSGANSRPKRRRHRCRPIWSNCRSCFTRPFARRDGAPVAA
jgi:hypothetical protein